MTTVVVYHTRLCCWQLVQQLTRTSAGALNSYSTLSAPPNNILAMAVPYHAFGSSCDSSPELQQKPCAAVSLSQHHPNSLMTIAVTYYTSPCCSELPQHPTRAVMSPGPLVVFHTTPNHACSAPSNCSLPLLFQPCSAPPCQPQ
jgi:hypothetical protein